MAMWKKYQMVNPLKSPLNIITAPFSYGFPMVFISDNATKKKRGSRLFGAQPLRECHTSQLSHGTAIGNHAKNIQTIPGEMTQLALEPGRYWKILFKWRKLIEKYWRSFRASKVKIPLQALEGFCWTIPSPSGPSLAACWVVKKRSKMSQKASRNTKKQSQYLGIS